MNTVNFENSLIHDCLEGSRRAQFQFYNQYKKEAYGTCLRMMGNKEDANDAIQGTFIEVFTKLNAFRGDAPVKFWIKRITINNCLKLLKERQYFKIIEEETLNIKVEEDNTSTYDVASIKKNIAKLAPGFRSVINLYLFEGYDHLEIAEILGISVGTSKSQYSRAKQQLKKLLQDNHGQLRTIY